MAPSCGGNGGRPLVVAPAALQYGAGIGAATAAAGVRWWLEPLLGDHALLRATNPPPEEVPPLIDMMQRQVEQMVRLIDDLLDVARISRGRIELRTARTELAAVIRNAVEVAQPLCDSMNHRFEVAVAPEPIFLEADAARLAQVIGNLLNNACKFTPRGGQVRLEAGTEGGRAVVRVRDNGVGIPADQLPRIFATFSQLDSSLDRSQGGWGSGSRWPAA